jgi:ATP-dependent Lon protease
VGRPASAAAIGAALAAEPPLCAVFAQRSPAAEEVTADALYPVGCEAIVRTRIPSGDEGSGAPRAWVILEGLRWITLEAVDQAPTADYLVARVAPAPSEGGDPGEVEALAEALRATARALASALPAGDRVVRLIDAQRDAGRLADLVVANLPVTVAEKVRYAAEPRLAERLRLAGEMARRAAPR